MGWWAAAAVFMVAALACLGFFRDPERTPPTLPGAVVAPADGRVMVVTEAMDPWVGPATRVSIFLSPLDVHVNRAPVGGLVKNVEYTPGRFLAAYRPEASEENERCTVSLEGETARVAVKQIAGVLARRIVCRVRPGDSLRGPASGTGGSGSARARIWWCRAPPRSGCGWGTGSAGESR
jgi:phosphatidylserine decarboxylase